jgi:uncharacterized iron-regulated membrane protein
VSTTADRQLPEPSDTLPLPSGAVPPPADAPGLVLIRLIRRVHFYAGVLVAPFLAVLCLTGIAYVFTPQINDVLYARELIVAPQPVAPRPLDSQVAVAMAAFPDAALDSVQPAVLPDRATAVVLDPPGAAGDDKLAVYVDPYTADMTGTLTLSHGEPPVQRWLRDFHGDLQLGTVGAIYSELAASWLPVMFLGGIVLWVRKRRARRRDFLVPAASTRPGRARMLNWHGSVGIWLTVALVFISLTGLTWSTFAGSRFDTVLTALDARTPKLATTSVPFGYGSVAITVGQAETVARAAGLQGPLTLTPPAKAGAPFVVAETSKSVPLHRDKIALDPATGTVLETLRFGEFPLLAQLSTIGILAHTGTLLGLFNQIAMTAMSLGILAVIFWGYRMWWLRRPTRGGAPRPLELRGVLRASPQPLLLGILAAVVVLGWLLPVFGISLVVFLAADVAAGAFVRRRAG